MNVESAEQPVRLYKLLNAQGEIFLSPTPGELGGNANARIYGRLECKAANNALPGYAAHRVFFADEAAAIAAGYRPCGQCMRQRFKQWKAGGSPGTRVYPWLVTPESERPFDQRQETKRPVRSG